MVGCPAQNEQIARYLGQIKRVSGNVERTRRSIGIGLKQLQEIAHQRRRQVGRIGIPEQDIKRRRIIAEQIVVDYIVPDQVIGPQPSKATREAAALNHALFRGALPCQSDAIVRHKARSLRVAGPGFQHAHHHRDGVSARVTHRREFGEQHRHRLPAGTAAGNIDLVAAGYFTHDIKCLDTAFDIFGHAPNAHVVAGVAP